MELSLALAQIKTEKEKGKNLQKIKSIIKESKAEVIIFPEFSDFYVSDLKPEEVYKNAETEDSEFLNEIFYYASENRKWVILGVYEKSEDFPKTYSAVYVIEPEGKIRLKYRKTHLFKALGYDESVYLKQSDNTLSVFEINGIKAGLMICYEIRFPEIARSLALKGAEALIVPSAWLRGYNKEEQWITLAKARAMENTAYVLTSNQIGNIYTGITLSVDPAGVIKARASEIEEVIEVKISKDRVNKVRSALPLLEQRRPELYKL
ncbi:MAG: carbon-nitrogen hydrolase family protein [Nitrososphaeria archaeon]|nr:carbon-nitrogen hydrolase family protein [Conexivisphaerales archaeon]